MAAAGLKNLPLIVMLFFACIDLPAQSANKSEKKTPTLEDARILQEAMVWFKKAEEMIGTPEENSDEQAALFLKAIQIKPDFVEAHFNLDRSVRQSR